MARNKYPEETINKILEVSLRLFLVKGYEATSIQDILDDLGGLTKGAIYHHFKSKEEILMAVTNMIYKDSETQLMQIRNDSSLTGHAKLQKIFRSSLKDPAQDDMLAIAPNLLKNPTFLAAQLESCIEEIVPLCVQPIIEEGIADGSIQTDYPKELSEVLMILSNIWLNPMVLRSSPDIMLNRCRFLRELLLSLGLDLFDDTMLDTLQKYAETYNANISKEQK